MNINLDSFKSYPWVSKTWGTEIWLTNQPDYCSKLLLIDAGMQCSLHYHPIKSESFIVLEGTPAIETGITDIDALANYRTAKPGESIDIPTGLFHRFGAPDGSVTLLEISTHHDDTDVCRIYESGPCFPF